MRLTITLLLGCIVNIQAAVTPVGEQLVPLAKRSPAATMQARTGLDEHPQWRLNTDNSGNIQNEEQACISPVNSANFVAVWRDFRLGYRRVGFGYSTNAGATWTDNLFPAAYYPWQSDPVLVVNSAGVFTANMISFDPAPGGEDGLLQLSSDDGGRTWRDSVWAAHATTPVGFEDKQMLAVDVSGTATDGSFYCAWAHFYGPGPQYDSTHVWLTAKRLGEPYGAPVVLSQTRSNQWANVCTGPDGTVYVSWCNYRNGGLMFTRSTDGGQTWQPERLIVPTVFISASITPDLLIFAYGVMAADHSGGPHHGRLYMVYTDAEADLLETDVWLIYSDDRGATWSPRARMDDETATYPVDQFHPWLSVDEAGRVWVVFYDRRHDPDGVLMDVYFTASTDGGQTWRANERVTTVSSDPGAGTLDAGLIGEYIGWQARGGKALCAWTDTRLGDQDVFATLIDSVFTESAVDGRAPQIAAGLDLHVFPNPANPATQIRFTLPQATAAELAIYDLRGRQVDRLAGGRFPAGEHVIRWDAHRASSGIYFAQLRAAGISETKKILLLR